MVQNHFITSNLTLKNEDDEKFYQNNFELKGTEDEDYTIDNFLLKVKQEVSKFINRSFDNIVVLAGAGASVVSDDKGQLDSNYGKTIKDISKNIQSELKEENELFSLEELISISKYEDNFFSSDGTINDEFNLEDFLSNLLTYEKFIEENKEKYVNSKLKIFNLIQKYTKYGFNSEKMNHAALLKKLSSKVKTPNKLTIVTTNYDTLFEDAAESINFTVIDGFSFSHKPKFDSDIFEWNLVKDIPNIKTNQLEYKKNLVNLLKIHGSLTWEKESDEIILKNKDDVDKPLMIFPNSNKYMQSYQDPYFELFAKFQDMLKKENTLLITTGFSFADNHISKMISQAIMRNPGLAVLISDYNINQENDNWKKLARLMNEGYQIAFLKATLNDNLTDFIGDNYDNR